MPLNIIGTAIFEGTDKIPYYKEIKHITPYVLAAASIKWWFRGATNTWERKLHGKVYIVTGATSQSMGTSVVYEMARLGAQLIILTRNLDEWSTEWIDDLRERTGNELLYMERCDLSDLYDIRKFATKWLDNSPPRRLDGVIVMSGDMEPWGIPRFSPPLRKSSVDGLELQMAVNNVGVFHLLNLLQPSFKTQPPDRDVRIIVTTCWLQALGDVNVEDPLWQNVKYQSALKFFASSKLQMSLTLLELQRRLLQRKNKDKKLEVSGKNVKVVLVQPGTMRSPSLRRIISNGSVLLLIWLYCVLLYPFFWFFVKSGNRGAQSILYALNTPELEASNLKDTKAKYVTGCSLVDFARKEFSDDELQKELFDNTERDIFALEKIMAVKRKQKNASKSNNKNKMGKK